METQDVIQELYKVLYLINTDKEEYAKYKIENVIQKLERAEEHEATLNQKLKLYIKQLEGVR